MNNINLDCLSCNHLNVCKLQDSVNKSLLNVEESINNTLSEDIKDHITINIKCNDFYQKPMSFGRSLREED